LEQFLRTRKLGHNSAIYSEITCVLVAEERAARDNRPVQTLRPDGDDTLFTFVDRPKASLRIVTLAVWAVASFLLYKALIERPPQPWVLRLALAFFVLCCCLVLREFMLRPVRVTTVCPLRRQVVIRETAPWHKRQRATTIPPGARFEIFQCDSDDVAYFGVRIRSQDKSWLTVAEFLSKENAEDLADEANDRLRRVY